jgi:hypothetical protein
LACNVTSLVHFRTDQATPLSRHVSLHLLVQTVVQVQESS